MSVIAWLFTPGIASVCVLSLLQYQGSFSFLSSPISFVTSSALKNIRDMLHLAYYTIIDGKVKAMWCELFPDRAGEPDPGSHYPTNLVFLLCCRDK